MKEHFGVETPQSGLVFMENFYRQYWDKTSILDSLRDVATHEKEDFKTKYENLREIIAELKTVRDEKIPSNRTSGYGPKAWQAEQEAKILALQKKIINFE